MNEKDTNQRLLKGVKKLKRFLIQEQEHCKKVIHSSIFIEIQYTLNHQFISLNQIE